MKKFTIVAVLSLTFFLSCAKKDDDTANSLTGTWVFTNQLTHSYAYPSVLTGFTYLVGSSSWSTTVDSIKIIFDNNGNYTFWNFNLPIDYGKYMIAQDSFLILKPDTAGFVKFNYTLPSAAFTTGAGLPVNSAYSPYAGFHFSSDTVLFKKSTDNNIIFSGTWLTKASNPIPPTNDTLIFNQSLNYFRKQ